MNPFCEVFYKNDDKPGWKVAVLGGDKETAEKKIENLGFKEYRIFDRAEAAVVVTDRLDVKISPYEAHLTSKWLYSLELDKWFLPDEKLPVPEAKSNSNSLDYSINLDDMNDDLDELYDEDSKLFGRSRFFCFPEVRINNQTKICWEFDEEYYKKYKDFITRLEETGFSFFVIEEINFIKLLAWDLGEEIRVKIQDYSFDDSFFEPVDILMNKDEFLMKFRNLLNDLQKILDDFKIKFDRCTNTVGKIKY